MKDFCKQQWKILIEYAIKEIKTEINTRKTKGQAFHQIVVQLDNIYDGTSDFSAYELDWFEKTYSNDVCGLRTDTKEKIDIEKYDNNRYYKGLLLGFIFGIIASLIATILYVVFTT